MISDERRCFVERYATSVRSSNLKDDETHHQTEILAAVALAQKNNRKTKTGKPQSRSIAELEAIRFGSALMRIKYCGDQSSLVPFIDIWRGNVLKWSLKHGWASVHEEVADISLWHWIDDICKTCHGRSHPVIAGTPILEIIVCPSCNGTGHRGVQCDAGIKRYVEDCVNKLDSMVRVAARASANKLREE